MRIIEFSKKDFLGTTNIDRKYYVIETNFDDFSEDDKKTILKEASDLVKFANSRAANTGDFRPNWVKEDDAFVGILAEFSTLYFLNSLIPNSAERPFVTTSLNQVDIEWKAGDKKLSVEVRSSFVKNGIPFALYAIDKKN